MKKCVKCGAVIPELPGNRKYCKSCTAEAYKDDRAMCYERSKARFKASSEKLFRDVRNATEMGMNYGDYMACKREFGWR